MTFYMLEIESVTIEREWVPRKKTRKALNEEFDHQDDRSKKNMDRLDILIDIELKGQIKCD